MRAPLHLSDDVLDEIGGFLTNDPGEIHAWLDLASGTVETATSLYGLGEDDDADDFGDFGDPDDPYGEDDPGVVGSDATGAGDLPTWQAEERERVRAILADTTGRYVEIPQGAHAREPGVLADFAASLTDLPLRDAVRDAMRGRGAFRRVKDLLHRAGKAELWYAYEEARTRGVARAWVRSEGFRIAGDADDAE